MKKSTRKTSKPRAKTPGSKRPEKEATDFPGYPLYPSGEDIMKRGNRLDVDVNSAIEGNNGLQQRMDPVQQRPARDTGGDSNLTKDDFQALGSDEIESTGDDEILANRSWPVDFTGSELDVPGSEQDDTQEEIGSEDEENNSYSLGSDRHSDLDEGRS
jgi:hypothetical protein